MNYFMDFSSVFNLIMGAATIIAQVGIIFLLGYLITGKPAAVGRLTENQEMAAAFTVALIATAGSLTYSEILGFEPCVLCWWQRIFMYPQVILLGVAAVKREKMISDYAIILAVIGAVIALYHYLLQVGAAPTVACSIVGYSVDCAETFGMRFGYITIPMMALTAFILIAVILSLNKKARLE